MDPLSLIAESDGFFTRQHALSAGYDDREIAAMVRSKQWVRFRRGYYAMAHTWAELDERGRHLIRARAVLHSLGEAVRVESRFRRRGP
jgi:hypothetical protein